MTHQPPLPAASTPPYPLHPAAHEETREQPIEGTPAEVVEVSEPSATREVLMKRVGIGAAVGIGSAAIAAALLYVRGGAKGASGKDAKRGEKSKRTSDDTTKRGKADRSRVAGGEQYEVSYFARRHKITAAQAREIIAEAGPDRESANRLAERRKQA